jgi:DNA-binding CsgD family transcriptional regulator
MSKKLKETAIILILFVLCLRVYSGTSGYIRGTLILDDSWERNIYVSLIETFDKEFTVSESMIIVSSQVDTAGRFSINLDNLPAGWCLLRIHAVKKGNPSASLYIGGLDENYCFIIANRYSEIELHNSPEKPIFSNLVISGAPYMNTFEYITNLTDYPNSFYYENSLIEKEFIEEVVSEKLRLIADTCTNPLVSLYALYQTDFLSDYEEDPAFYKAYLSKWRNENSSCFIEFRRQFPRSGIPTWQYILLFLISVVFVSVTLFIRDRRKRKIRKLSVQERRVFELLQKGASNQEISDKYNIELSTVKSHVSSIFSKLNIKSRKDAINLMMK